MHFRTCVIVSPNLSVGATHKCCARVVTGFSKKSSTVVTCCELHLGSAGDLFPLTSAES